MFETSVVTIVTSVVGAMIVVFLEGLAQQKWLEPAERYRKLKADIAEALVYYANIYTSPALNEQYRSSEKLYSEAHDKASAVFRELAAQLVGFYELKDRIQPHVPPNDVLYESSRELIGLSNSLYSDAEDFKDMAKHNVESVEKVKALQNIGKPASKKTRR